MDGALDRSRGALLGLAVGDALGTTLEFRPRGSFKPLTDMVGGGHFCLKKGHWTDDTSMALCLGHSLVECQGFDPQDQMRRYCDWLDHGYLSSIGSCFDVGTTVSGALRRFQKSGDPYAGSQARWSAGNGSIMRLAPIAMVYAGHPQLLDHARNSSRTTHGAPLCIDSCAYLAQLLAALLQGASKPQLWQLQPACVSPELQALANGDWRDKSYAELKGSGYVLESLEAALWCFDQTDNYADCVLAAANLGDDADTTAAVAGQLAGTCYGASGIRADWRAVLYGHDDIQQLADQLHLLRGQLAP